jgi:hypothetical protein
LKRKLLSLAILVVAFCLITPSLSANAQISHDKQTSTDTESLNDIIDLGPEYYPYTQAKITMTFTSTLSYMYNLVTDAKGNLHINGKVFVKGTIYGEAWVWDDTRNEWILSVKISESAKQFFGYNELSFDSEIQTSKETRLITTRTSTYSLDLDTGQPTTSDILLINHVIVKFNNGELQFKKSLKISHGSADL